MCGGSGIEGEMHKDAIAREKDNNGTMNPNTGKRENCPRCGRWMTTYKDMESERVIEVCEDCNVILLPEEYMNAFREKNRAE